MNRRKKINGILKKRLKQHKAKLNGTVKAKYVSKADRAKLEAGSESLVDSELSN